MSYRCFHDLTLSATLLLTGCCKDLFQTNCLIYSDGGVTVNQYSSGDESDGQDDVHVCNVMYLLLYMTCVYTIGCLVFIHITCVYMYIVFFNW